MMSEKTEYDFGRAYAEWGSNEGEDGFNSPVDINTECSSTTDIPPDDYTAMVRAGIENPNARRYWEGFNSFFA